MASTSQQQQRQQQQRMKEDQCMDNQTVPEKPPRLEMVEEEEEGHWEEDGNTDAHLLPEKPACPEPVEEEEEEEEEGPWEEDGYTDARLMTVTETPACSEAEEEEEEEEDGEDEVDGWKTSVLVNTVKSAVYHLLNLVIRKYRVDKWYGCKINHPSQRQHECLDVLEDDFYEDHYYHLVKRLVTPRFIPSIQRLLTACNIREEDFRVRTVAETLLHELRNVKKTHDAISDAYENLVGQDMVKIGQLRMVTECYTSD